MKGSSVKHISILDTTLRDGAQGEGIFFSIDDKIKIAKALDGLGIEYIEGGNPAANPKDFEFFTRMANQPKENKLRYAKLCAFGSTRRPGTITDQDKGLNDLIDCGAEIITLFGKASLHQVNTVLRCTPEENLLIIQESVAYLVHHNKRVFFDAEHFFDGYLFNQDYAIKAIKAAIRGGAENIILCDTNGGMLPQQIIDIINQVRETIQAPLGIHCHNDSGMAVANTILAVECGAIHVQGTIGGVGERCGNSDLCSVIPNLELKLGYECLPEGKLKLLTQTARYVSEILNLAPNERAPFVGNSAFAHKGGMHIDGVIKNTQTFEHIAPEAVGNHRRFLVSDQAGRSGILARLNHILPNIKKDSEELKLITERLKRRELRGYTYENADGSFALMALDTLGLRKNFYQVLDFHVLSNNEKGESSAQAYIKILVDGKTEINAAEGDGPVNALDIALRKALAVFYPCLNHMRLKDFSVRVLDRGGTASTVRVLIESTDGHHIWNTVGVSTNIIHACFKALCDSVDYLLTYHRESD